MRPRYRRSLMAVAPSLTLLLFACSSPQQEASQAPATAAQPAPAPAPAGPPAYEGFHDGPNCQVIYGWVWDRNRPGVPLSVEIFNGNAPLVTVNADRLRQDLVTAGKSNGQHSFQYPVPDSLKDGQPHSIRIVVAGADFQLRGTPKTLTCPKPSAS